MRKRLRETLSNVLFPEDISKVYNSFDVVGNIAIIRLPSNSQVNLQTIAMAIMNRHRNIKTVLLQASPVTGELRLRRLAYVAGKRKTKTIHSEYGCSFSVDVEKCYFSPRLSYERMRIAKLVESHETIVNMFAGVGCFSIIIAKYADPEKVFSIDINPEAVHYMQENIRLNRVYGKVKALLGDSKEVVNSRLREVANRVLMPLPEKALEYLPCALSTLKTSGGWIHYYGLEHSTRIENRVEKAKSKVVKALKALSVDFKAPIIRFVRSTGPNWFQFVADIQVLQQQHSCRQ